MGAFSNFVMSGPFEIEISESQEELEKALRHATAAVAKKDCKCFIGLRAVKSAAGDRASERLGRDEAVMGRCNGVLD